MQLIQPVNVRPKRLIQRTCLFFLSLLCAGTTTQAQVISPYKGTDIAACTAPGYVRASVLLPGNNYQRPTRPVIDNAGNSYFCIAVPPSTTYMGLTGSAAPNRSAALTKMTPDGTVLWNRWMLSNTGVVESGAYVYVVGNTANLSLLPGISGALSAYAGAGNFLEKIDPATGTTLGVYGIVKSADCFGASQLIKIKNDTAYCVFATTNAALPVTDGSALSGSLGLYVAKMSNDGTLVYGAYVAAMASSGETPQTIAIADDGGMLIRTANNVLRIKPSGSLAYKTAYTAGVNDPGIAAENGAGYRLENGATGELRCIKTDASGRDIYNTQVFRDLGNSVGAGSMLVQGDYLYFECYVYNSIYFGMGPFAPAYVKVNKNTGAVVYNVKLSVMSPDNSTDWALDESGNIWVTYQNPQATVIGFNGAGDIIYQFASGSDGDGGPTYQYGWIAAKGGKVFMTTIGSEKYPYTKGTPGVFGGPIWTAFDFNPDLSAVPNTITAPVSSVCKFGAGAMLNGNKVDLSMGANVPQLYRNGKSEIQQGTMAYQWQQSTDSASWTNVAGATAQNYLPKSTGVTMYYRRQVTSGRGCGSVLSTSNAIKIAVNAFTAPTATQVVASGYTTCPGTAVSIGLNITGGTTPYTVSWDNTTGTLSAMSTSGTPATAIATPTQSTVYTATITDSNGCVQYGQASVMAYSAGANKATSKCAADSALIGRAPVVAGTPGISYAWLPTAGLACPGCAQTKALNPGTYTMTLTVPVTGGGTCVTSMKDTVKTVAAPAANFAGPDMFLCSPANSNTNLAVTIGKSTTPGAAYTYTWSPGNYLLTNNSFNSNLRLGSVLPVPNPLTYFLTATTSGGCRFVDSMVVSVLRADAGIDGCGPRMIGNRIDPTPGITGKTYSWTRIDNGAGAASFSTGADTTQITTYVTSGTIDTRFKVTVKDAAGNTCSDTVLVTADCGCVNFRIDVLNPSGCPQFVDAATPIRLKVNIGGYKNDNLVYDWSPKAGLDRYDSSVVTIADAVGRTYVVSVKDKNTGVELCSVSKTVNGIGWSLPDFDVKDTTLCPVSGAATKVVNIGRTGIAGYSYQWTGLGLSATNIANPAITIGSSFGSGSYSVRVIDNLSGCTVTKNVKVSVTPVKVNAGADQLVCGSALTMLANGIDSMADYAYAWTPASDWKDGTDSTYLHARVAIATDMDYVLKATDLKTGCSATDTVHVQTAIPASITIGSKTASICKGSSLDLSVPLYAGASYTWTSSDPADVLPVDVEGANKITVRPQAATTYGVSVNYGDSCAAITGSKLITVTDLSYMPTAHAEYCPTTSPATVVLGPSLAPTGGVGPYTYSWSPMSMVSTPNSWTTTLKVGPKATTDFQLTITDANGCAATVTETVPVASDSRPVAGAARSMCLGTTELLGDAGNTGVTWFAAVAPASVAQLSSTTDPAPVFTPTVAGTYKFYVQGTGCINPDTVIITVKPKPALNPAGASLCAGPGSYATIGADAVAGMTYQWSPVTGLDNPNVSRTIVRTAVTQNYTLTATDAAGCQNTVTVTAVVNASAGHVLSVPALNFCQDKGAGQFMTTVDGVLPSGKYTAIWTPADYLSSGTEMRPLLRTVDTGRYNYTIAVTDQTTGCVVQAPATAAVSDCSEIIVPLPIKLLRFNAQPQNRQSLLNWTTGSEQVAAFFEVQSSVNGNYWNKIGKVLASSGPDKLAYSFIDEMPQANTVYYRLKMMGLDGNYEYSPVRQVQFGNAANGSNISWYPNPSNGQITVKTATEIAVVRVSDLSGRVVFLQNNVTDGAVLNLDQTIGAGIYIISFESNGQVQADKLILTK